MIRTIAVIILFAWFLLTLSIAMGMLENNLNFACCNADCQPYKNEKTVLDIYFSLTLVAAVMTLGLRCYDLPSNLQFFHNGRITTFIALITVFTTMLFCNLGSHVVYRISTSMKFCNKSSPSVLDLFSPLFWCARVMVIVLYYLFAISENITIAYTAPPDMADTEV